MPEESLKAAVPILEGESNHRSWSEITRLHLEWDCIDQYIDKGTLEPAGEDEKKKWNRDRIKIRIMFSESLIDPKIRSKLKAAGLKPNEKNPFTIWDTVRQTVMDQSGEAVGDCLREYHGLEQKNFGTMDAFIAKAQYLRDKLGAMEYQAGTVLHNKHHIWTILNALEAAYPSHYMFWVKMMRTNNANNKTSTFTWATLMEELVTMVQRSFRDLGEGEAEGPGKDLEGLPLCTSFGFFAIVKFEDEHFEAAFEAALRVGCGLLNDSHFVVRARGSAAWRSYCSLRSRDKSGQF
ncbi:hypothetical protein B0T25DRAFT_563381 [Lasiosphaeria hispida]|uniref:Uncharacterized protein n=1 Tax=Lasiosphaeria hispida TaxID=260671 RepID=A0AAJ0HWT4_9PEZI|nr:hypothetical protein B0T25DRAFT_563381 [Lasiosphaeria hispida]